MKIIASGPITTWQTAGEKVETVTSFIFLGSKITADGDCSHKITLSPWKKNYDKPRPHIKKQKHHFASKGPYSQNYAFSNSHVWIWVMFLTAGEKYFYLCILNQNYHQKDPIALSILLIFARKLCAEEWMLSNCGAREDLRVLGQQGDQTSQP